MNVEEAVDKATMFLVKSGYPTYRLLSVKLDKTKNEWVVKFDVGAIMDVYATVTIDNATGSIVSYERA